MTDLWRLSASEIVAGITAKDFSAREVIDQSLQRLEQVNPKINAVVQKMPEQAMERAKQIDLAISSGDKLGSLTGVPVTIKVNVDQQGFSTTNGLVTLKDNVAESDSPVVENLLKSGAIVVGRTNTPAFSMRWFTRSTVHGHTLNPVNPTLTPGGSSGGAASAVASGICAIGHGTDIAGSIRYPAYACGLHGIRPTLGRVPAFNLSLPDRHIPAQITAVSGPIARTVEDVRLGYEAMSTENYLDPWWVPVPRDLGAFKKVAALCTNPDELNTAPEIIVALKESARQLEAEGWTVVEVHCPPMRKPAELQLKLWMSEYALNQGKGIEAENDPDANFVYQQLVSLYEPPTLASFMELLQLRVGLIRQWQQFLGDYPIVLCPVSAQLPFTDLLDLESPERFREIIEAQMPQIGIPFLSIPAMTVTTGISSNVPVGVQLVAGRFREDVLFQAAKIIEAACPKIQIAEPI